MRFDESLQLPNKGLVNENYEISHTEQEVKIFKLKIPNSLTWSPQNENTKHTCYNNHVMEVKLKNLKFFSYQQDPNVLESYTLQNFTLTATQIKSDLLKKGYNFSIDMIQKSLTKVRTANFQKIHFWPFLLDFASVLTENITY